MDVKWLPDRSGRFTERPHYEPAALDDECERVVRRFLTARYGTARYPIATDDLTVLVEQHAGSLDPFADLPPDIEGRTRFYRGGQRPDVAVNLRLQEERFENRLRTTLTHELGHVVLHTFMWEFAPANDVREASCNRDRMIGVGLTDWMEWQAGYACGAFLMPKSAVARLIGQPDGSWPAQESARGVDWIARVSTAFAVSEEASRVRLAELKYVLPRA